MNGDFVCKECGSKNVVFEFNKEPIVKKQIKVYLDDERKTPDGWVRVYTPYEAMYYLSNEKFEVTDLSLDHDLGHGVGNGYDVLLWLEEELHRGTVKLPNITIHSANPPARKRMLAAVKSMEQYLLNEKIC